MDNNQFIKYLKTLGLDINANKNDIKSAYRKLVKIHHPDMFNNPENKEKASKNFKIITKAYDYLLNNYIPPKERIYTRTVQNENKEEINIEYDFVKVLREMIKNATPVKMVYYTDYTFTCFSDIYIIPLELSSNNLIAYSISEDRDRIFVLDRIDSVEIFRGNMNDIKPRKTQEKKQKYYEKYDNITKDVSDFSNSSSYIIAILLIIIYLLLKALLSS